MIYAKLTNEKTNQSEWQGFPTTQEALMQTLGNIGFTQKTLPNLIITGFDCSSIPQLYDLLDNHILSVNDLDELNYLAHLVQEVPQENFKLARASCELDALDIPHAINILQNLDCYTLLKDIEDDFDLGKDYIANLATPLGMVEDFIKFEALGNELQSQSGGYYTEYGYIFGNDSYEENYSNYKDVPNDYRLIEPPSAKQEMEQDEFQSQSDDGYEDEEEYER